MLSSRVISTSQLILRGGLWGASLACSRATVISLYHGQGFGQDRWNQRGWGETSRAVEGKGWLSAALEEGGLELRGIMAVFSRGGAKSLRWNQR
jgi:hypothetical protein